ncbi:hypothetical protein [Komagataeibacter diospyri]|uniref:Uncharacterized protein n=1 Tax=Komagataeibacter diospyri TaxID=1932662 RepID=A0A4V0WMX0_9PROT|nr:hypothetical protein [Komagataeibacter diospyri]GCE85142.1 hypothetical protein MSKU9_3283 [Komagataeibacter diospyri]
MIRFLKRYVWPWSEIERLKRERITERERRDLLELLDYTDHLVGFCAAHMPDVQKYYDGANAFWSVAHRIAGNDKIADRLRDEIGKSRRFARNG